MSSFTVCQVLLVHPRACLGPCSALSGDASTTASRAHRHSACVARARAVVCHAPKARGRRSARARQFIDPLRVLERDCHPTELIGLFSENSEAGYIVSSREFSGSESARASWETSRNTFGEVNSSFRNVIVSGGRAAPEWTTTGTSPAGAPLAYGGVNILEMAVGKITPFRACFDRMTSATRAHRLHRVAEPKHCAARNVRAAPRGGWGRYAPGIGATPPRSWRSPAISLPSPS